MRQRADIDTRRVTHRVRHVRLMIEAVQCAVRTVGEPHRLHKRSHASRNRPRICSRPILAFIRPDASTARFLRASCCRSGDHLEVLWKWLYSLEVSLTGCVVDCRNGHRHRYIIDVQRRHPVRGARRVGLRRVGAHARCGAGPQARASAESVRGPGAHEVVRVTGDGLAREHDGVCGRAVREVTCCAERADVRSDRPRLCLSAGGDNEE